MGRRSAGGPRSGRRGLSEIVFPRSGGRATDLAKAPRGSRLGLLLLGLAFLPLGCRTITGSLEPRSGAAPDPPKENYKIGAAKIDITPVPGYPMGGFSIGGQIGRGVWNRLYARAIYLEDKAGTDLLLVSCDLPFLPGGLADRVAELVRSRDQVTSLSREQIILAATHTHQGPGNFSSNSFYNVFGSVEMGFDSRLFDFLANRIALAITTAVGAAENATLTYGEDQMGGLSMNRSLKAFRRNPESRKILDENKNLNLNGTVPWRPRDAYLAIDPTLAVLKAVSTAADRHTIAVLSFFAMHPTTLGPPLPVYDSDVFGVAAAMIEQDLAWNKGGGGGTVAAFFNGAEGDICSVWKKQDREDVLDDGRRLSQAVLALSSRPDLKTLGGNLEYRCQKYAFPEDPEPMFGAPVMGGAENGRSFFYDLGWREYVRGNPDEPVRGHGTKRNPLDPLGLPFPSVGLVGEILEHVSQMPTQAWVGVYRIGPEVTLVTLPGEFTTTMGRRIRRALHGKADHEADGDPPDAGEKNALPRVLLVGLANEYVAYFTCPEEHDAQAYSGASMVYGKESALKVKDFITQLATKDPANPRIVSKTYSYDPGMSAKFGIDKIRLGTFSSLSDVKHLEPFIYGLDDLLFSRDDPRLRVQHPFVHWVTEDPAWPPPRESQFSPIPRVSIQVHEDGCWVPYRVGNVPETDEGYRFVTLAWGLPLGKTAWTAIWMAPRPQVAPKAILRFRMDTSEKIFFSRLFSLEELDRREDANVPMKEHFK